MTKTLQTPINFLVAILLLGLGACATEQNSDSDAKKAAYKPNNYVVLLDLSDRLLNENQVKRDTTAIFSVLRAFEDQQKQKLFKTKDEFQVVVAYQKGAQKPANYGNLAYKESFEKRTAPNYKKWKTNFVTQINDLYRTATEGKTKTSDFHGADIWRYFEDIMPTNLKKTHNNYLFVITDGYFDFEIVERSNKKGNRYNHSGFYCELRNKDNWAELLETKDYGLVKLSTPLPENTKVMVLEIHNKHNWTYETDMLKRVWSKWLREQGVNEQNIELLLADFADTVVNEKIKEFINAK